MSEGSAADLTVGLVVGSMGRFDLLSRFVESLTQQSHRNFMLIVVEQVDPGQARNILSEYPGLRWQVVSSDRGLSRARNRGLEEFRGDVLAIPDDDCWYEPDTLSLVVERFAAEPNLDMLVGVMRTATDEPCIRTPDHPLVLDLKNVWRVGISPACFFRASAVDRIGRFDPELGVGSGTAYQSGEETEFLIRGLKAGMYGEFDPEVIIRHPAREEGAKGIPSHVGRGYGMGMGIVLRRHSYSPVFALWMALRPALGAAVSLARGRRQMARFRLSVASGRLNGYFKQANSR